MKNTGVSGMAPNQTIRFQPSPAFSTFSIYSWPSFALFAHVSIFLYLYLWINIDRKVMLLVHGALQSLQQVTVLLLFLKFLQSFIVGFLPFEVWTFLITSTLSPFKK